MLATLGVLRPPNPTHKVYPTLYVIGRDGKVRWSDRRSRYKHEPAAFTLRKLEEAIDEALKAR